MDFFEFLSTEFAARSKPPSEIIIVKRLIQGRNNVARVRVEPRPFNQGRRKSDAFTQLATLPTVVKLSKHSRQSMLRKALLLLFGLHLCSAKYPQALIFAKHLFLLKKASWKLITAFKFVPGFQTKAPSNGSCSCQHGS